MLHQTHPYTQQTQATTILYWVVLPSSHKRQTLHCFHVSFNWADYSGISSEKKELICLKEWVYFTYKV